MEPARLYSKSRNTPFAGWRLKGRVRATIVGGRVVYRDGASRATARAPERARAARALRRTSACSSWAGRRGCPTRTRGSSSWCARARGRTRSGGGPSGCTTSAGGAAARSSRCSSRWSGRRRATSPGCGQGDLVDVLGPHGRGFALDAREHWLVSGGRGLAPLFYLARLARRAGLPCRAFLGGRAAGHVLRAPDLERLGCAVEVATDDGSRGRRGLVTELLARGLARAGRATARRHPGLGLRAARDARARWRASARGHGVAAKVSVDPLMACGRGLCLGCTVPAGDGYRLACQHGPVFDAGELVVGRAVTPDLSVRLGALELPNPVLLASGTCGYGLEMAPHGDLAGLGAVVVKGLSLRALPGQPAAAHRRDPVGDAQLDRPRERRARGVPRRQAAEAAPGRRARDRELLRRLPRGLPGAGGAARRRRGGARPRDEHLVPEREARRACSSGRTRARRTVRSRPCGARRGCRCS